MAEEGAKFGLGGRDLRGKIGTVVGWLAVGASAPALIGCSTLGGDPDVGRRVDALETDVGKMKTDVDRLTKIEGDLNLVVGRLNEVSPAATPAAAAAGGSGIYLGSYRGEASAREAWRGLTRKFEELRGVSPLAFRVDLGAKGVFARLIAGPFPDTDAARAVCARLAAAHAECTPATYSGKPLG